MRRYGILAAFSIALLAAGCGDDDESYTTTTTVVTDNGTIVEDSTLTKINNACDGQSRPDVIVPVQNRRGTSSFLIRCYSGGWKRVRNENG